MRDGDIDSLTADAAQVTAKSSSDPRAALAEAAYEDRPPLGNRPIPQPPRLRKDWEAWAGRMQPRLAERGVLLVTEADCQRASMEEAGSALIDGRIPVLHQERGSRIFAALSERQESAAVEGPEGANAPKSDGGI